MSGVGRWGGLHKLHVTKNTHYKSYKSYKTYKIATNLMGREARFDLGGDVVSLGISHGVVLVVQHLEHEGDVAEAGVGAGRMLHVDGGHLLVRGGAALGGSPAVVRIGRRGVAGGLHPTAHGRVVVDSVAPPHVKLGVDGLATLGQALTEVRLPEAEHHLAVHVPLVEVKHRHRERELLQSPQEPRTDVALFPLLRVWRGKS